MYIFVTGGCGFIGSNFVPLALDKLSDSHIIRLRWSLSTGTSTRSGVFRKFGPIH